MVPGVSVSQAVVDDPHASLRDLEGLASNQVAVVVDASDLGLLEEQA